MGKPLKLILDTHIFIYYMNGSKMPTRIKVAIENAKEVLLSTITSWEIFMLAKHGHITLSLPPIQWYDSAIAESGFKEIPISSKISNIAVNLKWDHKDPADRWIVATAISEGATLVTLDRKILAFKKVKALSLKKDK